MVGEVEAVWSGKRGYYWIEAADADEGGVIATAVGPAPGPVGPVVRVTAPSKQEAVSLAVKRLEELGA